MSQIDELRRIIVGDNSEQLSELKERVESIDARTRDVAEVLAPAITKGLENSDDIIDALAKPVSQGLKRAIRSDTAEYADILYPAIAPSIRLAISQAISSLLTTINQTVASATSISGLRTRLESARTGVPYAELVLRKALLYRVEHLYLIDRETGLLIAECAASGTSSLDSDAVSAMFAAIQSFVQDSFSNRESDRLTDLKVGAHNIWVAHSAKVMLACVILGDAPESLKLQLNNCLDQIQTNFSKEISSFDGDSSEFEGVDLHMRPLLQLRLKYASREPSEASLASKIVVGGLVLLAIYLFSQWADKHTKLATLKHYLRETPGMLVTSAQWRADQIVVQGLQDPDAELPTQILLAHGVGLEHLSMRTTPFRSLEAELEVSRFNAEFDLPEGLELFLYNGAPVLRGVGAVSWLLENDLRLRQLANDRRLNIDQLTVSPGSLAQYLDDVSGSQFELTGKPGFTEVQAEIKSTIFGQVIDLSWSQVPAGILSRNTILHQFHSMLGRSTGGSENTSESIDSAANFEK
ncbi:MAG: hypothetical protein ACI8PV_000475 [Dinoroseobacter sp.]|jgi:hypothetical protein